MSVTEESMEGRLIFVIAPPRSGSTLLMRVLAGHSAIYSRPEPHVVGPLAHLGYFATVDAAPYDQYQAAAAMRGIVADLPRGEADYLDACRAYVDLLYGRLLRRHGGNKRFFLDKTPANALVLPFLTQLYPHAHYVVLTRHPAAIFSSYAHSFFAGDFAAAHRFNPILERYVPAMAQLLRERSVPLLHVHYETFVTAPDDEARRICAFLEVEFEPTMIEYGASAPTGAGLGDPITVERETRPVASSRDQWASELAYDPAKLAAVQAMTDRIDPSDLEVWGYPAASLYRAVVSEGIAPTRRKQAWNRFLLERRLLLWLRRDIQTSRLGKVVRRTRELCDILLRG